MSNMLHPVAEEEETCYKEGKEQGWAGLAESQHVGCARHTNHGNGNSNHGMLVLLITAVTAKASAAAYASTTKAGAAGACIRGC